MRGRAGQTFLCMHEKMAWASTKYAPHSFFYKNTFYKNIEAVICKILRIF